MKERLIIVPGMLGNVFAVGKNNLIVYNLQIKKKNFRTGLPKRNKAGKNETKQNNFFHKSNILKK